MKSTIQAITDLIFINDKPQKADLVFVLGNRDLAGVEIAVDLYKQKLVPKILISGGIHKVDLTKTECELMTAHAVSLGVPKNDILQEDKATNTLENFTNTINLVDKEIGWKNTKTVILTGKSFHGRRAIMTAKKNWPKGINYLFIPFVDIRNIKSDSWWKNEHAKNRVLGELERIGKYAAKGDLEI